MKSPSVTFLLGLPGSGKTNFAKSLFDGDSTVRIIHLDSIRRAMGHEYHPWAEHLVHSAAALMISTALIDGKNVVVDEALTSFVYASILVDAARLHNARIEMVLFKSDPEKCWEIRKATGMPKADFKRKIREWGHYGLHILGLAEVRLSPADFIRMAFYGNKLQPKPEPDHAA